MRRDAMDRWNAFVWWSGTHDEWRKFSFARNEDTGSFGKESLPVASIYSDSKAVRRLDKPQKINLDPLYLQLVAYLQRLVCDRSV